MQGLLIKNILDVIHYEKNLCENIFEIIFNTKDLMVVQEDFKECGIQPHLWLQNVDGWFIKHATSFVLSDHDKDKFTHTIINTKTPTLYASSLRKRIIMDGDLKGMKSHDFHVMMQDILLLCMQGLMSTCCRMSIMHLCHVFKKLCAKILDPTALRELKKEVAIF